MKTEADTRTDAARETVERWRTRGWTTIVLEKSDDGRWPATQDGISVENRDDSTAAAAADYCRRVEGLGGGD